MNNRVLPRLLRETKGQSLVELTLVVPILLMLVLGIATFGIAFNRNIMLTDAIRTGARTLATSRGTANPCNLAGTQTRSGAITLALASLTLTSTVNGTVYTATAGNIPQCSGAGVLMLSGADVVMLGTYPCSIVIMGINFAPSCTLSAQTTARVE